MNIANLLEMVASASAGDDAVVCDAVRLSAPELLERAGRSARVLLEQDAPTLVHVAPNDASFPVALFAAAWAGIPFVPLNYRLPADQLAALVANHPGAVVVAEPELCPQLSAIGGGVVPTGEWLAATGADTPVADRFDDDADAVALLLYTSGTTASPKAVVLRHRHLTAYVLGTVEFLSAARGETALVSVPPYHIAGVSNLLTNLYRGRRIVYLGAFRAESWLDTSRAEKVTHAMVVPTMLARIVDELHRRGETGPPLRSLSYGGAKASRRIVEQALELFPETDFVNAYGLTETSSTIAVLGPEDHRAARAGDPAARVRLDSAGRVLPGVEISVRDPHGAPVATGKVGEIHVRGEQVSGEYIGRGPTLDPDGWFPTRDLGCLDDAGYLFIAGRGDDTIIRGGENIAPAEIESVLAGHPAVADVAVVGLPDEEWGERIGAVVVASGSGLNVEDLRGWARSQLRRAKTPDVIVVRDRLPYSETGKLLRRLVLADLLEHETRA